MARQKTKIEDKFKSGGDKDGSIEEKFFTDTDIQIDQDYKVIKMITDQLDEITEVVNANDQASGSYADLKKVYTTSSASFASMSGSLSTRVTSNDAKVSSPFPAITTKQAKTTVSIQMIQHIPAVNDDSRDTLNIVIGLTNPKGQTTLKQFVLNASS